MIHLINVAHAGVISDAPRISNIGMNILNFLLSVVGIIAIISLVLTAILYATSAGDEKRARLAKKIFQASVLGIILAMGAFVLIAFVGQFF